MLRRLAGRLLQVSDEGLFQRTGAPLLDDMCGGVADQDLACVHQRNAVAALSFIHEVGGDKDGHAITPRQLDQQVPEAITGNGIDTRGWLIEDQQLGAVNRRHRQGQTLADPQRQAFRKTVQHVGKIEALGKFSM